MKPLTLVRFGLPAVLVAVGLALVVFGGESAAGAGVVIIGSAALVSLANLLLRFSIGEMQDRQDDQDARDFYSAHGRWPDEPEPEPEPEPAAPAGDATPPPRGHPGVISRPIDDRGGRTRPRRERRPPRRPRPGP